MKIVPHGLVRWRKNQKDRQWVRCLALFRRDCVSTDCKQSVKNRHKRGKPVPISHATAFQCGFCTCFNGFVFGKRQTQFASPAKRVNKKHSAWSKRDKKPNQASLGMCHSEVGSPSGSPGVTPFTNGVLFLAVSLGKKTLQFRFVSCLLCGGMVLRWWCQWGDGLAIGIGVVTFRWCWRRQLGFTQRFRSFFWVVQNF